MPLALMLALLRAGGAPGAQLVIGRWATTGGYGTLPAVIDLEADQPLWLGSRHLVHRAVKTGLFDARRVTRHAAAFVLSREGSCATWSMPSAPPSRKSGACAPSSTSCRRLLMPGSTPRRRLIWRAAPA